MEPRPAKPSLRYGRFCRGRRYGRIDLARFDNCSRDMSIAQGIFHKVNIDCRFRADKSSWGVLGPDKNLAGIIYLDLTFHQPPGSRLHSAIVTVTLDDDDKALRNIIRRPSQPREIPLHITECYGPKGIVGPETIVEIKEALTLNPNLQFLSYGLSLLEKMKAKSFSYATRWGFSGDRLSVNGQTAAKTLKWSLSENVQVPQSNHRNEFHTAFTFEHGGQPFFMHVQIEGKLRDLSSQVKDVAMKKFQPRPGQEDGTVVTLINFGERIKFTKPLDEKAEGLKLEMDIANLEVPGLAMLNPSLPNPPSTEAASEPWAQQQGATYAPSLRQQVPGSIRPPPQEAETVEDAVDPTILNLKRAFTHVNTMDRQGPHYNDDISLFENRFSQSGMGNLDARYGKFFADDEGDTTGGQELSEEQLLLRLLRVPAFLIILRFIIRVLGLEKKSPKSESIDKPQRSHTNRMAETRPEMFLPWQKSVLSEHERRAFTSANGGHDLRGPARRRDN